MLLRPVQTFDDGCAVYEVVHRCPSCEWTTDGRVVLRDAPDVVDVEVRATSNPRGSSLVVRHEGEVKAFYQHICRAWVEAPPDVDEPLADTDFADWPDDVDGPQVCGECGGSGLVWG